MSLRVVSRNCWICEAPALDAEGKGLEPFDVNTALQRAQHARCLPLAELARRAVYQTDDRRLGDRPAKLHIRTSGAGTLLLCKHDAESKRRVGAVRDFGSVHRFSAREDACAVCAAELAGQVQRILARSMRMPRGRGRVVDADPARGTITVARVATGPRSSTS